jgi:hypothetical protein
MQVHNSPYTEGGAMKKTWEAPKLIVLVRGRIEERILGACKSNELLTGPIHNFQQCEGGQVTCPACIESVST